jgi:hypothetical protein
MTIKEICDLVVAKLRSTSDDRVLPDRLVLQELDNTRLMLIPEMHREFPDALDSCVASISGLALTKESTTTPTLNTRHTMVVDNIADLPEGLGIVYMCTSYGEQVFRNRVTDRYIGAKAPWGKKCAMYEKIGPVIYVTGINNTSKAKIEITYVPASHYGFNEQSRYLFPDNMIETLVDAVFSKLIRLLSIPQDIENDSKDV